MTVAHYLVNGTQAPQLDPVKFKLRDLPPGATCFITGAQIARGYHVWDIVPNTTNDLLGTLHSGDEWMSETAARAWKGSWNLGARLIFEDGAHYHPLIARKPAEKKNRACWSSLIRDIWPARRDENLLCIIATDFKKRIWFNARIGTLGQNTGVFVHDPPALSAMVYVNWEQLISTLNFVEMVYSAGFTKSAIRKSLLSSRKAIQKNGLKEMMQWEKQLQQIRNTSEFHIAQVVAQKIISESLTEKQLSMF